MLPDVSKHPDGLCTPANVASIKLNTVFWLQSHILTNILLSFKRWVLVD